MENGNYCYILNDDLLIEMCLRGHKRIRMHSIDSRANVRVYVWMIFSIGQKGTKLDK